MRKLRDDYNIEGVDFDSVYNRNELIVRKILKKFVEQENLSLSAKDLQDVYALTLNDFPSHYVHPGTVVLFSNIEKQEMIKQIVRNIALVQARPKD